MAREIKVNTSSMDQDINALQEHLNKIRKNLESMYEAVRLLDTMWDGPANEVFNRQFMADREAMEAVCENVEQVIKCMQFAKKEYENCDNEVGSIVSAIRV